VLYEDDDLLIVDKPAYLLVHTDGNTFDTLTNRVQYYYQQKDIEIDAFPVHRIDFETSGMIIFAKHFLAQSYFSYLFEAQELKKIYVCVCRNPFDKMEDVIKTPIGKDRHTAKQIVSPTGKTCETKYQVIEQMGELSKVFVEIKGGRKHQIRVHMASINHPIVGDKLYGINDYQRMLLHFKHVEFIHPRTMQPFVFESKEPF
ncbi:MAG: RluA family pseudouridine synthase, partial [Bacillota bacterium]